MSALIVGLSVAMAILFAGLWLARADVRERVEGPKHRFQEQLRRYDRVNPD